MKMTSRWTIQLLITVLMLLGVASKARSSPAVKYLWSDRNSPVMIDLNRDGKIERLVITTNYGISQNWNTLKIFDNHQRLIFQKGFSSAGGAAIGNFLGKANNRQVAVWDFFADADEANLADHHYGVYAFGCNQSSKISPICYYKTVRKYSYDCRVKGPLYEYLSHKSQAISLKNLTRQPLDEASFEPIRRQALRNNSRLSNFSRKYRFGPWAIFYRTPPGSIEGEWELWEKRKTGWIYLAGGSSHEEANDMESNVGIPALAWNNLKLY